MARLRLSPSQHEGGFRMLGDFLGENQADFNCFDENSFAWSKKCGELRTPLVP